MTTGRKCLDIVVVIVEWTVVVVVDRGDCQFGLHSAGNGAPGLL